MWQEYYVYLEKNPKRFFHVHSNQAHMLIVHVVTTLQNNTFQCMHFRVISTTKKKVVNANFEPMTYKFIITHMN